MSGDQFFYLRVLEHEILVFKSIVCIDKFITGGWFSVSKPLLLLQKVSLLFKITRYIPNLLKYSSNWKYATEEARGLIAGKYTFFTNLI